MTLSYHTKKSVCTIRSNVQQGHGQKNRLILFRPILDKPQLSHCDIVSSNQWNDCFHILTLIEMALKMNENYCEHC